MICMRYIVSGKVQGVWFRASTKEQALQLHITGYAKNLADGKVEVIACGEQQALDVLYAWLQQGPPMAKVTNIDSEQIPEQNYSSFNTA